MNRRIILGVRVLVLLSALFGTLARLIISLPAELGWSTLLYFTVQSNLMVCFFLVLDSLKAGNETGRQSVHGGILLYISITGIIYNLMLASSHQVYGFNELVVLINHTVTPILFLIDWLLRQRDYKYSYRLILPWLGYPVAYLVFGSIEGLLKDRFRYPFLDFQNQNIGAYVISMIIVIAFFLSLSWLFIFINHRSRK